MSSSKDAFYGLWPLLFLTLAIQSLLGSEGLLSGSTRSLTCVSIAVVHQTCSIICHFTPTSSILSIQQNHQRYPCPSHLVEPVHTGEDGWDWWNVFEFESQVAGRLPSWGYISTTWKSHSSIGFLRLNATITKAQIRPSRIAVAMARQIVAAQKAVGEEKNECLSETEWWTSEPPLTSDQCPPERSEGTELEVDTKASKREGVSAVCSTDRARLWIFVWDS